MCVLALFSLLGHGFCSFFFLEHLKRARRYITRRDRGSSDSRGASYRHRKPPKLALFCGVPIPEKLEQAFVCCFAGHFVRDRVLLCGANIQATQMHVRSFTGLQQQRKRQQTSSQQRLVFTILFVCLFNIKAEPPAYAYHTSGNCTGIIPRA